MFSTKSRMGSVHVLHKLSRLVDQLRKDSVPSAHRSRASGRVVNLLKGVTDQAYVNFFANVSPDIVKAQ